MGCYTVNDGLEIGWKGLEREITKLLVAWKERGNPRGSPITSPSGRITIHPHGTIKIERLKTIEEKVNSICSLEELNGFANRSKVTGIQFRKWTERERQIILNRKYELEKNKC